MSLPLSLPGYTEKFSKDQAYYIGRSATRLGQCQRCRWYIPATSQCNLVLEAGEPTPGTIAPEGTCGLWNANMPRISAYEVAYGRGGGRSGQLPGVIRTAVIALRRGLGGY